MCLRGKELKYVSFPSLSSVFFLLVKVCGILYFIISNFNVMFLEAKVRLLERAHQSIS